MTDAAGVEAVSVASLLGWKDMVLLRGPAPAVERGHSWSGVQREDGTVAKLSDGHYFGCIKAIPELTRTLHTLGAGSMHQCVRFRMLTRS